MGTNGINRIGAPTVLLEESGDLVLISHDDMHCACAERAAVHVASRLHTCWFSHSGQFDLVMVVMVDQLKQGPGRFLKVKKEAIDSHRAENDISFLAGCTAPLW